MKGWKKALSRLLLAVFLTTLVLIMIRAVGYGQGDAAYAQAAQLANSGLLQTSVSELPESRREEPATSDAAQTDAPAEPEWIPAPLSEDDPVLAKMNRLDLDALREHNPDVIGWIKIPGTVIDYPLMQSRDNTYYLDHNWRGARATVGAIYLDSRNDPMLTDFHSIIYGHNMANGSMFAALHNYAVVYTRERSPYVYIKLDSGVYRYEIFSTYEADVSGGTFVLEMESQEDRQQFLDQAIAMSEADMGIVPGIQDRILALSTCTGGGYDTRRVVIARLKMIPQT